MTFCLTEILAGDLLCATPGALAALTTWRFVKSMNTVRIFPFTIVLLMAFLTVNGQDTGDGDKRRSDDGTALGLARRNVTTHRIGNLGLTVSNMGFFGTGFDGYSSGRSRDCFTGVRSRSCEIGPGTNTNYLYGATIWLGAVVGRDTLVSTGADGWGNGIKHLLDNSGYKWRNMEFYPEENDDGYIKKLSTLNRFSPTYDEAVSEEDIIAVYSDTAKSPRSSLQFDAVEVRRHIPMGLRVTQSSYAWSYSYADDFVLVNFQIENIGDSILKQAYFGLYVDGDAWGTGNRDRGIGDDITGLMQTRTYMFNDCEFTDTIDLAWLADNDGDYRKRTPVPGALGTRFLQAPNGTQKNVSYNWWSSNMNAWLDFGPRRIPTPERPWWDLRTGGLGTPEGDMNKYALLSNHEVDYNQIRILAISPIDTEWLYPNQTLAKYIPRGYDVGYLQSVGPFSLDPEEVLEVTVAFVSEPNFHKFSRNFQYNLQLGTYKPDEYMDNLNWKDFKTNATWASWVFDNPGLDTDGDGYFGRYHLCCSGSDIPIIDSSGDTTWVQAVCDTLWYEGDLQPDFQGATPPPAPDLRVEPSVGAIDIRWNGFRSENTADLFSRKVDFDGYRVYYSLDERSASYMLLATFDLENYLRWLYNPLTAKFELTDDPFSVEELRCLYGDSCHDESFDPAAYSLSNPLIRGDSILYFSAQDFNRSELGVTTPITKIYPDAPKPPYMDPTVVPEDEREMYVTEDGYFKYYEYQHRVENLLPTVPYFINVTAYDYGSPKSGLGSLETSVSLGAIETYPLHSSEQVAHQDLKVYIYPNPYRIDGEYLPDGFEGRDAQYYIPERMRRIHFVNLPPKCTIGIYSLDGDLIREFEHDVNPSDPLSSHDEWDMITRNTQSIVTGIYYWIVSSPDGSSQIGKLVVMR